MIDGQLSAGAAGKVFRLGLNELFFSEPCRFLMCKLYVSLWNRTRPFVKKEKVSDGKRFFDLSLDRNQLRRTHRKLHAGLNGSSDSTGRADFHRKPQPHGGQRPPLLGPRPLAEMKRDKWREVELARRIRIR